MTAVALGLGEAEAARFELECNILDLSSDLEFFERKTVVPKPSDPRARPGTLMSPFL